MIRKALKFLSIFILFSFNNAQAISFANKFLSHFAKIGLITKKPISPTLFSRPCSYLKHDAIAAPKKIATVRPSFYLGAGLGSIYYLNLQLKKWETSLSIQSQNNIAEQDGYLELEKPSEPNKQPTVEDLDKIMSLQLKSFLNENEKTRYEDFRSAILSHEKTLSSHPETKKIVEICRDFGLEKASENPDDLMNELYKKVTFKDLPEEMSKVALEKKDSIMYRPWKLRGYKDAMKKKIQEKK